MFDDIFEDKKIRENENRIQADKDADLIWETTVWKVNKSPKTPDPSGAAKHQRPPLPPRPAP